MVFEADNFTVSADNVFKHSSLAQSVEHLTVNQGVTGSSPVGGAIKPFKFICTFSSVGRATDS